MVVDKIIETLPQGKIEQVFVGLHWTAVQVSVEGKLSSGIACTLNNENHAHGTEDVPQAGDLIGESALMLAGQIHDQSNTMRSIAMATINALISKPQPPYHNINASEVIAQKGQGKVVSIVGHFPFIDQLRSQVDKLHILELNPQPGDLPSSAVSEVFPKSDVIAITSMTFVNQSINDLLPHIPPQAEVLILGPTTPLSPVLFEYGIDMLCGSVVVDFDAMLLPLQQGGTFRQVRQRGVQFVARTRDTL